MPASEFRFLHHDREVALAQFLDIEKFLGRPHAGAQPAAAAGFTDFLNNILDEFESAKQPIALIALMFIGAGWLFNFVDLRRAAWAVGGVVLIYASSEVLSMITG